MENEKYTKEKLEELSNCNGFEAMEIYCWQCNHKKVCPAYNRFKTKPKTKPKPKPKQ